MMRPMRTGGKKSSFSAMTTCWAVFSCPCQKVSQNRAVQMSLDNLQRLAGWRIAASANVACLQISQAVRARNDVWLGSNGEMDPTHLHSHVRIPSVLLSLSRPYPTFSRLPPFQRPFPTGLTRIKTN